ncbi:helix-turn-helix domain-containing protein [Nevskia soli]|uniref:helix-turn-helix domain-containing protein n=1 Tax=Nevskia soli TaxID=418856 RepID=UPI0009FD0163
MSDAILRTCRWDASGTRRDLALHYLAQAHLSLTEIGNLPGYAELSNFSHAFKRWTACSPRTYRRHLA